MARKKNGTFQGGSVRDIDVGAATFKRTIANVAGDVALIYDKLSGAHAEASTIIHDGSADRGALLGVPIINQFIGRSLTLESPAAKGSSGGYGDTWIYAAPFLLSAGETTLIVEVGLSLTLPYSSTKPYVIVIDGTTGAEQDNQPLHNAVGGAGEEEMMAARLTGLTSGWKILVIGIDTTDNEGDDDNVGKLHYVRARPRLAIGQAPGAYYEEAHTAIPSWAGAGGGTIYSVQVPALASGFVARDYDASQFSNLAAISGYEVGNLNQDENGLAEHISGFPAGGNEDYTLVDIDGGGAADDTNPAESRFEAHVDSAGGAGRIDFPIWTEGFGAFLPNGFFAVELVEPPSKGVLNWFAPWPKDDTEITIRETFIPLPDFSSLFSRLQCAVLFGSTHTGTADPTQYTVKAKTTTGSATNTPSAVTGFSNHLWLAIITAVPFTGDGNELVEIHVDRAAAKPAGVDGIGELCVLGASFAFVKP